MAQRLPFVGGNWKMNTDLASAVALADDVNAACASCIPLADVAIFPPFPYLYPVGRALGQGGIILGAQDVYHEPEGAFTGEVSVTMLSDLSVTAVLAGHSERRHVLGERDHLVNAKVLASVDGGLWAVLCVGETLEQRRAGTTNDVIIAQLRAGLDEVLPEQAERQLVVAYEPVWAIGTGVTATPEDAQQAHAILRTELGDLYESAVADRVRIIYGGSVKGSNAQALGAGSDVDGFLVGGASLEASEFAAIVAHAAGGVKRA